MHYQIIDNFINAATFLHIQNEIYGPNFPWFQNDHVVFSPTDPTDTWSWQLTHMFYYAGAPQSSRFSILEPIIHTVQNAITSCRKAGINYLYLADIDKLIAVNNTQMR